MRYRQGTIRVLSDPPSTRSTRPRQTSCAECARLSSTAQTLRLHRAGNPADSIAHAMSTYSGYLNAPQCQSVSFVLSTHSPPVPRSPCGRPSGLWSAASLIILWMDSFLSALARGKGVRFSVCAIQSAAKRLREPVAFSQGAAPHRTAPRHAALHLEVGLASPGSAGSWQSTTALAATRCVSHATQQL